MFSLICEILNATKKLQKSPLKKTTRNSFFSGSHETADSLQCVKKAPYRKNSKNAGNCGRGRGTYAIRFCAHLTTDFQFPGQLQRSATLPSAISSPPTVFRSAVMLPPPPPAAPHSAAFLQLDSGGAALFATHAVALKKGTTDNV